jgi:hypothetical protein
MNFYETNFPNQSPPNDAVFPCVVLVNDGWNDVGYYTLWGVNIYRSRGERIVESSVKILQRDPDKPTEALFTTKISPHFPALSPDYCSLGQDIKYYELLLAAGPDIYKPYFAAMRDAAIVPEVAGQFKEMAGFQKSLLRFSEAEKAFREAISLFTASVADRSFRFRFRCRVPGADGPHDAEFDFSPHPTGLHRTAVNLKKPLAFNGASGFGALSCSVFVAPVLFLSGSASKSSPATCSPLISAGLFPVNNLRVEMVWSLDFADES